MGRPNKLTDAQMAQVSKRLLAGETAADLAREFKVSRSLITRRFQNNIETVKTVAHQLVSAEEALRALPVSQQLLTISLADDLRAISTHLAGAAKFGSATAHRLAGIANGKAQEIDDAAPLTDDSLTALRGIAALTKVANEAAATGLNLLSANKDTVKRLNEEDPTGGVATLQSLSTGDLEMLQAIAQKLQPTGG